jgi:osmotically-inducible protein OsmY
LNGSVDSAEQKARAEQLAWQANGVKTVVNNLQVVPNR